MRVRTRSNRGPLVRVAPEVYHIRATELRRLGLETVRINQANAYAGRYATAEERAREYEKLRQSMARDGFSESHPIVIWVNRFGKRSAIGNGHHRLSIAIELGIEFVPVKFSHSIRRWA